jgi:hypothetical protein
VSVCVWGGGSVRAYEKGQKCVAPAQGTAIN